MFHQRIFSAGPTLVCNSAGRWDVPEGTCQCRAGFEPNEDFSMCVGESKFIFINILYRQLGEVRC